jgi:hypothetical protein
MMYVLNHRSYQKLKLVGRDNSMLKELLLSLLFSQVVVMSINLSLLFSQVVVKKTYPQEIAQSTVNHAL